MDRTVLHILIASPSDTEAERQVVSEVIEAWNSGHAETSRYILQGLRWERDSVPEMGASPQEILNRQLLDRADIVIAVFSSRLGTPTNDASSGTVEEINIARSAGKPVLIYFSNASLPRNHDPQQLQLLNEYKNRLKSESLFVEFNTIEELSPIVARNLAATIGKLELESSPWAHYNRPHSIAGPANRSKRNSALRQSRKLHKQSAGQLSSPGMVVFRQRSEH